MKRILIFLATLLTTCVVPAATQSNALTNQYMMASGVTGTGNCAPVWLPGGLKTFEGWVTTTSGAGSATVTILASMDGVHWVTDGTMSLTAASPTSTTPIAVTVTDSFVQYECDITAITGTGAAVSVLEGN